VPKEVAYWVTGNDEETIKKEFIQQRIAQKEKARLQNTDSSKQNIPINRPPKFKRNNDFRYFPGSYAVFILVFAVGTCLSVMQEWKKIEDHKEEIEREKVSTELSFLKSQINPHFFFNTLNNIYSLAITGSAETAKAVMKLSSIMRYVLTDTQNNKVPLLSEVDFIKNYIDLQLVRLTDKVKVDFITEGELDHIQIAPLLFIPFIENAFKYGISTKDASAIFIKLSTTANHVSFVVNNTIVKSENIFKDTTGIGINNVKRRLELLYAHKHRLEVTENNDQFIVHLDIDLI
jgi:sensor histidine kinase YesM